MREKIIRDVPRIIGTLLAFGALGASAKGESNQPQEMITSGQAIEDGWTPNAPQVDFGLEGDSLSNTIEEPSPEPTPGPTLTSEPGVEQPIEEPIEEPTPTPGPTLTSEPGVEQPIEEPIEEPTPSPGPTLTSEPGVEQPIENPIEEPSPTPGPIPSPPEEGVEQPIEEPIEEPFPEPTPGPIPSPPEEGVEQPIEEPIEEPFPPQSYTIKFSPDGLHGVIIPYPDKMGRTPSDEEITALEATKPYTFTVGAFIDDGVIQNLGVEEAEKRIRKQIELTNKIYRQSDANVQLELAGIWSAQYPGSGHLAEDNLRITRPDDGYMDWIPGFRRDNEIDMVGYYGFYDMGVGGCGYGFIGQDDSSFYDNEYYSANLNTEGPLTCGPATPEEISHLFGCGDSWHFGLFNSSGPFDDPVHNFYTWLSTGVNCIGCEEKEIISNPNVKTEEGWPAGDPNHNNVLAIRTTAPYKDGYFKHKQVIIFLPIIISE